MLALAAEPGCGRFDFDFDGTGDAGGTAHDGSSGGSGDGGGGLTCTPSTAVPWLGSPVPNDPGSGLPRTASLTTGMDATGKAYVTDNVTGLVWERDPDVTAQRTFAQAQAYCAGLTIDGCSLWRVPEMPELATIVDHQQTGPVIDPTAFPGTPTDFGFWTSTLEQGSVNSAWATRFGNGNSSVAAVGSSDYVRCVLSSKTADVPPARYTVAPSTVFDKDTGLTWALNDNGAAVDYPTAVSYCSTLVLGTATWRVPSIRRSSRSWTGRTARHSTRRLSVPQCPRSTGPRARIPARR